MTPGQELPDWLTPEFKEFMSKKLFAYDPSQRESFKEIVNFLNGIKRIQQGSVQVLTVSQKHELSENYDKIGVMKEDQHLNEYLKS